MSHKSFVTLFVVVAGLIFCMVVLTMLDGGEDQNTVKVLEANGFNQVVLKGYDFFGCPKDDIYRTMFEAKNAQGRTVTGTVCKGWFTGAYIRLNG